MGDAALWEMAEGSLREALDEFAGKGGWRVNAGDGAFYGPKIDIKVRYPNGGVTQLLGEVSRNGRVLHYYYLLLVITII